MREGPIRAAWALDRVAMNGPFQDECFVEIRKARGVGVPGARRVERPVSSLTPTTRAEGRAHEAPTPIAQEAQPATIVDASQTAEAITKQKARW